jgi:hypothetical protein
VKTALALALTLLCASAAHAQFVKIPGRHHVPNLPGGYCVPASVETVGRLHKIARLHGYRDRKFMERQGGPGGTTFPQLVSNLDAHGVRYDYRPVGNRTPGWVRSHLAAGRPVIVAVRSQNDRPYDHAVVVTGVDNQGVLIVNSNPPHVKRLSPSSWAHRYAGGGVAIYPNR